MPDPIRLTDGRESIWVVDPLAVGPLVALGWVIVPPDTPPEVAAPSRAVPKQKPKPKP